MQGWVRKFFLYKFLQFFKKQMNCDAFQFFFVFPNHEIFERSRAVYAVVYQPSGIFFDYPLVFPSFSIQLVCILTYLRFDFGVDQGLLGPVGKPKLSRLTSLAKFSIL
eukprot:EG_transcript_64305